MEETVWRRLHARRGWIALFAVAALLGSLRIFPISAQGTVLASPRISGPVPVEYGAGAWGTAAPLTLPLTAQASWIPNGGGNVPEVTVRSLNNGSWIGFLVEWADATKDVRGYRTEDFPDAVAVEIAAGTSAPNVCMGQADSQLQIWHWRANRDAFAGADPSQAAAYPWAVANDYPFWNDSAFYPAWAADNFLSARNTAPVQTLVAGGPGTLTSASAHTAFGRGWHDGARWHVVFLRPLAASAPDEIGLEAHSEFSVAFAAWDGSAGDRDGMKSTSSWITLSVSGGAEPPGVSPFVVPLVAVAVLLVLGVFALARHRRKDRDLFERHRIPRGSEEGSR